MSWGLETQSLGGTWTSGPGAVLQTGGRLVVFDRGTDNAMWHRWQLTRNGAWSDWGPLGGTWTSDPDCALNAPGGLVVFARGTDGAIWHCWQEGPDGDWSGWASLGGQWTSGPSALLQTGGRLVVFARGTDNAIWHRWQLSPNGDWSDWGPLGGTWTSDPGCALNAPGGLVVFARGTDNAIWHRWQEGPDGNWSGWASLGGQWTSAPSAALLPGGKLSVVARGTDSKLWQRSQVSTNGSWGSWTLFGGTATSDPDVALNADGSLVVFALQPGNAVAVLRKYWVPDPAPEPERTTVPRLVGLLSSQILPLLQAARLQLGQIANTTGEIRSDRLRVIAQDPAPGASVAVGTRVNYRVELAQQLQGIASIQVQNRHQQGRPVEIYVHDSATGVWTHKGSLTIGANSTLSLSSGRIYTIVAVDPGLTNCNGRPDNVSCQRLIWGARGDSEGVPVTLTIF
ncbi:PASTA domain-containing protein [Pyxidicoccus xibeiensis]|uniref:PASTA domain-containing protein n=1 Tax=Pyxidicoccus xibeiensis TaxID=2906759 RepID=UPI0020A79074|nr:PASTA domain-containing protein [Pyxidicoccus xibeiensis]MCP3136962.1 PASTA domain-containing protein [Pyxidicoccus xibeiensis]